MGQKPLPPPFPPSRIVKTTLFGEIETEESCQARRDWEQQMKGYEMALGNLQGNQIKISLEEYEELLKDQALLKALQEVGVHKWSGFQEASDIYRKNSISMDPE